MFRPMVPEFGVKSMNKLPVLFTVALLFLLGCQGTPLFEQRRVERQDQAGSVHIAPLFVAPWEDFINDLQPNFDIDEEKALKRVIPSTLGILEKFQDASEFQLKLAPPRTSVTETVAKEKPTGAEPTRRETVTEKKEPGDVSGLKFERDVAKDRKAAELPGKAPSIAELGLDPVLQHKAALALFQEVKLLNRYVRSAALRYDYRPYVVRLQVSLLPYSRTLPYDAFVTFSFFTECVAAGRVPPKELKETDAEEKALEELCKDNKAMRLPDVIPLLVTDNLEATLHSRAVDVTRQLGLALGILAKGFGAGVEAQHFSERIQAAFGRDLNSILTVGRVSDNTLRVRLGAQQQVAAQYAVVPRTHTITLLLLVPARYVDEARKRKLAPQIWVLSHSELYDAHTGAVLRERSLADVSPAINTILRRYIEGTIPSRTACEGPDIVGKLLSPVQRNEYPDFVRESKALETKCGIKIRYLHALWLDLAMLNVGSQRSGASFDLPVRLDPDLPHGKSQPLLLSDDGKKATITVRGGRGLVAERMTAELKINKGTISLLAETISIKNGGKEVVLTFPSLFTWNLVTEAECAKSLELSVEMGEDQWVTSGNKSRHWKFQVVRCRREKQEEKATRPGFKMSTTTSVIVADSGGRGTLHLYFDEKAVAVREIVFNLTGADIVSFEANPSTGVMRRGEKIVITQNAALKLMLDNLHAGQTITLQAENQSKVAHPGIKLSVVRAAK